MQVNIRIRDDLYKKLREEAQNWHRTITAQLEIILSEALETQEKNIAQNSIDLNRNIVENTDKKDRSIIGLNTKNTQKEWNKEDDLW